MFVPENSMSTCKTKKDTSAATILAKIDQYELNRELGGGGFGTVYLATDTTSGVQVAVKGLPPFVKNNREELETIRENFALVSRLTHTNIAKALVLHRAKDVEYVSEDVQKKLRVFADDFLMVMEYAPGVTLSKWRNQFPERKVPIPNAIAIIKQIASALDYAHEQKIVHRDIKPANIMIETRLDGKLIARVLDFGLAAEIRSSMGRVSLEIHDMSGTRPYMAPEQWLGEKQGSATDQYSLAVLFYELVVGKVPFASVFDCGDPAVMRLVVTTDPPKFPATLPKSVCKALAVALAKKPGERFASCGDFVAALEGKVKVEGRRSGGAWKVFGALAVLVALCGSTWFYHLHQERQREEARQSEEARIAEERAMQEKVAETERKAEEARREAERKSAEEAAKRKAQEEASAKSKRRDEAAARERAAELVRLKTQINIKKSDAKSKISSVAEFRADPVGIAKHIESADKEWKTLEALDAPTTLEEARAAFEIADKAEAQIALDLDWLERNKAGRDAARAASAKIDKLLKGDAATFKADKYASEAFGEGENLREKGDAAFNKGDFAEAERLMEGAKEKFSASIRDARLFMVKTTLESAKTYFDAAKWNDCIAECKKVLEWDAANAEATKLKSRAEEQLVPSARAIAKIGDRVVSGAKFTIDGTTYNDPIWKDLSAGRKISGGDVEYSENGRRYIGTLPSHTVDWRGPRTFVVSLKEYTGPKHKDVKTLTLPGGATMEMIYVAPGSFTMGSPTGEAGRFGEETQHRVTLTKGYWLGKYEVTQRQWRSVMGDNPSFFKGDDRPVEKVSWEDCQTFIQKVNAQLNCGARLPTEAEWEYACRAGTTTAYHWGNALNGDRANCCGDGPCGTTAQGPNKGETTPVGSYSANPWGFYDMHGNVSEWCNDWWGIYSGDVVDPQGGLWGNYRILRGGSWGCYAKFCRSACRFGFSPDSRHLDYGFRLCCSAGPRE